MKRRDFLKAGIGGAFALWGLGAMQEKTAMAAGDPMPEAMDMLLKITDEGFSYSWQYEKKWQHGNPRR